MIHIETKKNPGIALPVLLITLVFLLIQVQVDAKEMIPANTLVETLEDTEIKEAADEDSASIKEVVKGTTMFTVDSGENGWYKVKIREQEGYIRENMIALFGGSSELEDEFEAINNYDYKIFETVRDLETKKTKNFVWLIAMAALILITAILGIRTAKKNIAGSDIGSDAEDRDRTDKRQDE